MLTDYDVILFMFFFFYRDTTCDYGANVGASVMCRFLLTPRIILRGAGRSRFVLGLICHGSWECVYVFFFNSDRKGGGGGGLMVDSTGFIFKLVFCLIIHSFCLIPMTDLNILSCNINGLNGPHKLTGFLDFLRRRKIDIVLVQESHLKEEDIHRCNNKLY